ncbi:MAG: hypothetical protein AAFO07_05735, partial [Bacteroidota bacterium]
DSFEEKYKNQPHKLSRFPTFLDEALQSLENHHKNNSPSDLSDKELLWNYLEEAVEKFNQLIKEAEHGFKLKYADRTDIVKEFPSFLKEALLYLNNYLEHNSKNTLSKATILERSLDDAVTKSNLIKKPDLLLKDIYQKIIAMSVRKAMKNQGISKSNEDVKDIISDITSSLFLRLNNTPNTFDNFKGKARFHTFFSNVVFYQARDLFKKELKQLELTEEHFEKKGTDNFEEARLNARENFEIAIKRYERSMRVIMQVITKIQCYMLISDFEKNQITSCHEIEYYNEHRQDFDEMNSEILWAISKKIYDFTDEPDKRSSPKTIAGFRKKLKPEIDLIIRLTLEIEEDISITKTVREVFAEYLS